MSNKQISKDNREYWQKKLSDKFDEKTSVIQSLHQLEINEQTQKKLSNFCKKIRDSQRFRKYKKV